MALTVEHFSRTYAAASGSFTAVDDLSFTVASGEIVGLIGPNGAGKTTTLRSLAGILAPDRGRILVAGHDVATAPIEAKRALAFVPDTPHLFDALTVREHLRFIAAAYRVPFDDARVRADLAALELLEKAGELASTLSRGMQQKLAILCAFLHDPRVVLLDEPLTGLDPRGIRRVTESIRARAAAGTAMLVSSHLLHLVEKLCTRVLILDQGRMKAIGTLDEIRAQAGRIGAGSADLEEIFFHMTEASAAERPASENAPIPPT